MNSGFINSLFPFCVLIPEEKKGPEKVPDFSKGKGWGMMHTVQKMQLCNLNATLPLFMDLLP